MIDFVGSISAALIQVWAQILIYVPKLIIALIIWIIGKFLINLGVRLVKKINLKGTKVDDYLIGILTGVVLVVGKIVLVLVILDYLGVGRTIMGAIAGGLALTVSLALGLSFGKALEEDAREIVRKFKAHLGVKN